MRKYETLLDMLKRHEGLRLKPYNCSADKLTIGYGRNLTDVGISENEAMILLVHDMERALQDIRNVFPNFSDLPESRQDALTNMMFNLGKPRFLRFCKMIEVVKNVKKEQDWQLVADEAKDSLWYSQVGIRAIEIVRLLRNG